MTKYTIGIIGGSGSMGQWFNSFFKEAGHRVLISGRQTTITTKNITETCDIVIISTPIDAAIHVCEEVGPLLTADPQQILEAGRDEVNRGLLFFKGTDRRQNGRVYPCGCDRYTPDVRTGH